MAAAVSTGVEEIGVAEVVEGEEERMIKPYSGKSKLIMTSFITREFLYRHYIAVIAISHVL